MYRKLVLCLCVVMFSVVMVSAQSAAEDKKAEAKAVAGDEKAEAKAVAGDEKTEAKAADGNSAAATKEMSGMSIVGNDEAPKSLYIVPWKNSDIGVEISLDMMLTEDDVPVDRDVFSRQLEFYKVSTEK